nr:hypothetical protein [Tanacetum cinerariifolium]
MVRVQILSLQSNQSWENHPRLVRLMLFSKPVTSNSIPTPQESKVMKNDKVIAPGMFRINPFKTFKEEKHVPNKDRASVRTKPITVSQPPVFTKKDVNSDSNGLSSTGIDNTKTRRPHPRSNTKNDRIPSASKSSRSKNKGVEVEEHHRNLLLSKNMKHMSSACNNIKLNSQNVISRVVCAMCKQCLISINHDVCLHNYVNGKTSRGKKQKANVSIKENQKKQQPKVKKTKKVGFIKRLAIPKPSKPRFFLRWSPTGRLFDLKGKIIAYSESESQSDCSNGDNACYPDLFMVRRLGLFQAHDRKSKASHQFRLEVYENSLPPLNLVPIISCYLQSLATTSHLITLYQSLAAATWKAVIRQPPLACQLAGQVGLPRGIHMSAACHHVASDVAMG